MALWRMSIDGAERLARGAADTGPEALLPASVTIDGILGGPPGMLADVLAMATREPVPAIAQMLPPIGSQEIWAAGVTYRRSRDGRMEEAADPSFYDAVYDADRPELFVKTTSSRVRGSGQPIGIRADSGWDVPEPELGVVADLRGQIVAYLVGNDVSSRSIEGENPLYLPQAKFYTGSCAIGPCLVPVEEAPDLDIMEIKLSIDRQGETAYRELVRVADMRRSPKELVEWLYRALDFPVGVVLLTGTALVPPADFTLREHDDVTVTIPGLGQLRNRVELVGNDRRPSSLDTHRERS